MATLNPDDPNLDVYKEYINCSRPLPEWKDETPKEILDELKEEPKPGWVHWFFSFTHNLGLPSEKLQKILSNTPKGTKIWKNKIEGLRGKSTGLVFPNFDRKKHVITEKWLRQQINIGNIKFKKFTAGLDTSYSSKSPDTIAMIFQGITMDRRLITIAERVYSNADLETPIAPSDTAVKFVDFLEQCRKDWGYAKDVYIDLSHSVKYDELFRYTKAGGYVWLYVSGTISLSANTWHVVGILPDRYRPLSVSYAIIATYGTMDRFGILEVNPDGRVSVFSSQEIGWVAASTVFPVLS